MPYGNEKDSYITIGHLPQKIAVATQRGSKIANSHSYRQPKIFFRSSQTERTGMQSTVTSSIDMSEGA